MPRIIKLVGQQGAICIAAGFSFLWNGCSFISCEQAVRIVDLRSRIGDPAEDEREYARAHIPGAVYLRSRRKAVPAGRYRQIMEEIGINDDTLVIEYDNSVPPRAARLVWSLHYCGHAAACMLGGGFQKWVTERRLVEAGFHAPPQGHFSIRIDSVLRVAKDDVSRIVSTRSARLVDCRTDRSWSEAGAHIPGATHLPASASSEKRTAHRDLTAICAGWSAQQGWRSTNAWSCTGPPASRPRVGTSC